ncbi:MAG: hypothetical protein GEV08_24940 [Acidimicrobiia bacterium]|nr:hypothetical protein [Acidimicrobiia bacterium]
MTMTATGDRSGHASGSGSSGGSGNASSTSSDGKGAGAGLGRTRHERRSAAERASGALDNRLGRRGFLVRAALAGSAMTVAPLRYLLKPGTAYAAICGCSNRDCDCGASCCDGYTEFCCTLTGVNGCPPGSVVAGWWKADGSSLCGPNGPRYYMDCNAGAAGPCGASGVTGATNDCGCDCAGGDCGHRKTCCTAFRYGQCNQHVPCLGPIVCRVVTCIPPWSIEPSCTTAPATDNFTRFHDAPCLHSAPTPVANVDAITQWGSLPVVFSNGLWYRGYDRVDQPGMGQAPFHYGAAGHIPVMGDWDGDGVVSPGVFADGIWHLRNSNSTGQPDGTFAYGATGHRPVVGTWAGFRHWGVGLVVGNQWLLRHHSSPGQPDLVFHYGTGAPDEVPVVGDWNGDGTMTPGVVAPTSSGLLRWKLRNSNSAGPPDITFDYGLNGDIPVVGDWDLDGKWTPGVVRGNQWLLRNGNSFDDPDVSFTFDTPPGIPLAWASRIRR